MILIQCRTLTELLVYGNIRIKNTNSIRACLRFGWIEKDGWKYKLTEKGRRELQSNFPEVVELYNHNVALQRTALDEFNKQWED